MAAPNDVTVTINGPLPVKPIGVEITYAVNTVPMCLVAIDPLQSELLQDPDSYKRAGLITVTVNVKGNSITFQGYMDGLSMYQNVGSIGYSVVLKGQAQWLLESDTLIPGLSPYGMNPLAAAPIQLPQPTNDPAEAVASILLGTATINLANTSLADTYKQLAIAALGYQAKGGFSTLVKNELNPGLNVTTLLGILENPSRQKKLAQVVQYLSAMDTSALSNLQNVLSTGDGFNATGLIQHYTHGPRNMWENLIEFYGMLGAILIPTNNSIILAPNNGFIDPGHVVPGYRQHSATTNVAFPSDYNSTSYQDQGYVDVGYVALISTTPTTMGSYTVYPVYQGGYPTGTEDSISAGASLLIIEASPLVCQAADAHFYKPGYIKQAQQNKPGTTATVMSLVQAGKFGPSASSTPVATDKAAMDNYNSVLNGFGDNYAQMKFFQARYGDRGGSLTSRFNPNWCPGTVGYLYQRGIAGGGGTTQGGAGVFLDFMVQRVCHKVAVSAPNSGVATTDVSFNCGRLGVNTLTIESDKLYNYGYGQVQQVQQKFLSGVSATYGN